MRKPSLFVVLTIALVLALSACGSGPPEPTETPEPTPTISPTATPQPTPTSTPIPLSQVDLEPLLTQSGDLPAGLSGAQVRDSLPEWMSDALPSPENMIQRQFERDGEAAGGVTVVLYESDVDVDTAYAAFVDNFGEPVSREGLETTRVTVPDIAEEAEAVTIESELAGVSMNAAGLAFVRCRGVVHIMMTGTSSLIHVESYGKRLDKRLVPAICR